MKRLGLLVFAILILIESICFAKSTNDKAITVPYSGVVKKVALILDMQDVYAHDESISKIAKRKTSIIFKKPKFDYISFDETQQVVKVYREEHNLLEINKAFQVLKMADVQNIGKQLGADYVFILKVSNDEPRYSEGFLSTTCKVKVTCDARLMAISDGKYSYMKTFTKDGSSTGVVIATPSFNNSYRDALSKALDEVNIDTSTL